jgi:hypothetical protein
MSNPNLVSTANYVRRDDIKNVTDEVVKDVDRGAYAGARDTDDAADREVKCLKDAVKADSKDFGKDASKTTIHILISTVLLTAAGVTYELSITTAFLIAASRLFGTDVPYFRRTLIHITNKVTKTPAKKE